MIEELPGNHLAVSAPPSLRATVEQFCQGIRDLWQGASLLRYRTGWCQRDAWAAFRAGNRDRVHLTSAEVDRWVAAQPAGAIEIGPWRESLAVTASGCVR